MQLTHFKIVYQTRHLGWGPFLVNINHVYSIQPSYRPDKVQTQLKLTSQITVYPPTWGYNQNLVCLIQLVVGCGTNTTTK